MADPKESGRTKPNIDTDGVQQQIEQERKFDLEPGTTLPDLSSVLPVESAVVTDTVTLISAYYDTADRDLLALGVTLRRRTGDTDTGWQLKVPVGDARTELKLPLSAARTRVPKKLADLVKGVTLGSPLDPLLTVHTVRNRHRWTTPGGTLLVELAEDDVHATDPAGTQLSAWQEVEAELGPAGTAAILDDVGRLLLEAGAKAGSAANKVAKALGGPPDRTPAGKPGSALHAVLGYLAVQHAALLVGDLGLRTGVGDDVVHGTRVAVRRMRSTLRVYGKLFRAKAVAGVEDELRWYADLLGQVRDGDVQRERFAAAVDALPPEQVLGPVRARIDEHLLGGKVQAEIDLAAALDGERYLALLRTSTGLLSDPPLPKAKKKRKRDSRTTGSLRKPARHTAHQATDRLAAGLRKSDDVLLHRARKAGKRARYAAELLALAGVDDPLASDQAVAAWKELQDVLGEHQDSVVAADLLRRLGAATADRPGENGFTYGVLHQREEHTAAASRERAAAWTSPLG